MVAPSTTRLATIFALVGALGCDGGAVTLIVSVRSDLVPGLEVDALEVSLPEEAQGARRLGVGPSDDLERGVRVVEIDGLRPDASRRVQLDARLDGRVVATREAIVANLAPSSVTVLLARACGPTTCEAPQTCLDGRCVEPTCLTGAEPSCPRGCGECEPSSECDDARCEEGTCLHFADPSACDSDACVPDQGCVDEADPDAGPADAGARDSGVDAGADAGVDSGPDAGGDAGADGGVDAGSDAGPDVGPPGPTCGLGGLCDFVDQDCAAAGRGCVPRIAPAGYPPACVPVAASSGGTCADNGDCAAGDVCTAAGCRSLCCPAAGATGCPAGASCRAAGDGTFGVCVEPGDACGVLLQTGCGAGQGCYPSGCFVAGTGDVGETCSGSSSDCLPRNGCVSDECRRYCERGTNVGCGGGEFCAELRNQDLGYCLRSGCQPIAQTGCPEASTACYPLEGPETGCATDGGLGLGASCVVFNECAEGLVCAGGVCRTICDTTAPTCTCAPLIGVDRWGVCV